MVKQALKRRKPGFNESYYGFRSFSELLEEAEARQLLALEHDEKSGGSSSACWRTRGRRQTQRPGPKGSVTQRLLCIPVQSTYACKTRGRYGV